ncbi:hypothetical protein [Psychrobacter alimentarius]|nr:hypothetical protein [Psychrobacter alimentarius]
MIAQLSFSTTMVGWLAPINDIGYFIDAIAMFVSQRATWQAMTA